MIICSLFYLMQNCTTILQVYDSMKLWRYVIYGFLKQRYVKNINLSQLKKIEFSKNRIDFHFIELGKFIFCLPMVEKDGKKNNNNVFQDIFLSWDIWKRKMKRIEEEMYHQNVSRPPPGTEPTIRPPLGTESIRTSAF